MEKDQRGQQSRQQRGQVRRRSVLAGIAAAGLPAAARAQPATAMPMIGYLSGRSQRANAELIAAFQRGLAETGYAEGRNVTIEYRSSDGHVDQLPRLAADLVRLGVALLFASSTASAVAAKAATSTIPIVFTGASDPVRLNLVASLNKPGGNMTGVSMFAHAFGPKRLQLLVELVSTATVIAILVNPDNPSAAAELQDLNAAGHALNIETVALEARTDGDIEQAFATLDARHLRALYILDDPFFTGHVDRIVALAMRHSAATISTLRVFPRAGGLASYGTDFAEVHRQCGIYAGRILKGLRPAELPVVLPTRFELAINLKTAQALGIAIPPALAARADEVIE